VQVALVAVMLPMVTLVIGAPAGGFGGELGNVIAKMTV
jgi:hypothetical protein